MIKRFALLIFLVSSYAAVAEILVYPFDDPLQEQRFNVLIQELRCPKCQNNNLADSNAPLSADLKDIIYEKIKAGESNEQITLFLKERYGDFISYRPPLKPSTWIIWFGPFVILLLGGIFIFRFISNRQTALPATVNSSADSSALLQQWSDEISSDEGESE